MPIWRLFWDWILEPCLRFVLAAWILYHVMLIPSCYIIGGETHWPSKGSGEWPIATCRGINF